MRRLRPGEEEEEKKKKERKKERKKSSVSIQTILVLFVLA